MRYLLLTAILTLLSLPAKSQTSYNLPPLGTYPTAVLGLKKFGRTSATDVAIFADSIRFRSNGADGSRVLHLDEVTYIRVREGNNFRRGVLVGAVAGPASCLPWLPGQISDVGPRPGPVLAWATVIGAGVGGLIGALSPRRRSYYVHAKR